ncbi:cupin domain-containing protein [Conexibacter sp. JD483]|uniref:cupin domain-containing protein n=1 Tax=unclassified Conexibacter TaxID=2627773 RepID=UPI002721DC2D|nr:MULTISPECIES: cupin domain-containing protein [unclassified Conexibacter]MDO8189407.1 cupin domain-containing protein [Conexibacter sp. CPCC 205706]MDO8202016.1 cupin domain-containing protein [Conexibacter sp. CPCC 205762]MDR9372479.1 cupin domain-containing protein [Conexibacter sp. JD483]
MSEHPVYAVAGGNHVTLLLPREQTGGTLDVIDVLAQPGGGPPPHRHAFGEFFRALEGELTIAEERDGIVVCTRTLRAGETLWIPPDAVHATLNLTDSIARFQVIGQPGLMTGYFVEAGVRVPDPLTPPDREPPGPAELREISARWEIEFWTGPVDLTRPVG